LLNTDGQLIDSNQTMENFIKVTKPSESGNLPVLNNSGQIVDSKFRIDDSNSSLNTIWSSKKNDSTYIKLLSGTNLAQLGSDGQLIDSGINANDFTQNLQKIITNDTDPASSTNIWSSEKIINSFPLKVTNSTNLAQLGLDGQLHDSGLSPTNVMQKIIPKENGSIAVLDTSGQISDSEFSIDDTKSSSSNIVWSTTKNNETFMKKISGNSTVPLLTTNGELIDSNVNLSNVMLKSIPTTNKSVAILNSLGQTVDSGFSIDDTISSSSNILWSTKKIDDSYIRKTAPIIQNSLLVKSQDGNLQENNIIIDDSKPARADILWTSTKNDETFIKKLSGDSTFPLLTTNGELIDSGINVNNFAKKPNIPNDLGLFTTLDSSGQIIDSGFSSQDTNPASSTNIWSSEKIINSFPLKVTNSTNLAQLGLDGQLHDSGLSPTNVMQKIIPKENGSIAVLDTSGQISDSEFSIDDTKSSSSNIVWSTTKNNETFMKKISGNSTVPLLTTNGELIDSNVNLSNVMLKSIPTTNKSVAILNSLGQTVDSGFSIDDTISSSSNILWSTKKIDDSYIRKTAPIIQNSLLVKSQDGNLQENNIIIDDSKPASATVLWTSNKVQQNFITLPTPNTDGNCLQFDSTGKLISAKPFKMMIFAALDNAWYFGTNMYMGVMITKPTVNQYNLSLASNVNFNPIHTYHLTAILINGLTNGTTVQLQKKLSGNIPFNTTGSLNVSTLGTPTNWMFIADDKLEILFVDRTNGAIFRITCIFNGFSTTSHIVYIEQLK